MRSTRFRVGLSGLALAGIGILVGYRFGSAQRGLLEDGLTIAIAIVIVAALIQGLRGRAQSKMPADHVAGPERPWDQFSRELDRSRRFGRTFVIGRIPAGEARGQENSRTPDARLVTLPLLMRSIDQIWYSPGTVHILLAETDRAGMRSFLRRLQVAAPGLLPSEEIAVAQFPDDGLTTGSLLDNMQPESFVATAVGTELDRARDRRAS